MSKPTTDNQAITQYLLGALPEAETERLDELSVADDEFAEALKAAEKDLVDNYVRGELTGPASERFQSYYLASPLRREKVDFAQAFQGLAVKNAGAQAAEVSTENSGEAAAKRKRFRWLSALTGFTVPRLAWQWGFAAAALALLIGGTWLVFENVRLRQQMTQTQARRDAIGQHEQELQKELNGQRSTNAKTEQELARLREETERLEEELKQDQKRAVKQQQPSSSGQVASFILAPPMRGIGQVPAVSIPARTEYVALQLDLESADYPTYRVLLRDQSNSQILWRSGRLKPGAKRDGKALSITFRAGLLKPQTYILRVSGVSANGTSEVVSDYPFKVVE